MTAVLFLSFFSLENFANDNRGRAVLCEIIGRTNSIAAWWRKSSLVWLHSLVFDESAQPRQRLPVQAVLARHKVVGRRTPRWTRLAALFIIDCRPLGLGA